MGLLLPHKRKLRVYPDLLSVSLPGTGEQSGGGRRGDIKIFSAESRLRMFKMLHQIQFKTVTFATLTYPGEFPTDKNIYKAQLKEYRRRFENEFGKVPAVWRLEFQRRGAPHYHIMYLDCPFVPIGQWCNLWSDVIKCNDAIHRKIGVDVKLITKGKESKLVAKYLAKYIAKVDNRLTKCVQIKPGRWWGKWNIAEEKPIEIDLIDYQAELIVQSVLDARKSGDWQPNDYTLCSVMGESMGTAEFRKMVIGVTLEVLKGDSDK